MTFLPGLFQKKPTPSETHALTEVERLGRRIELLRLMIEDYHLHPAKYHQSISGPVPDAINQMILEKTKLEVQHLFLTTYF